MLLRWCLLLSIIVYSSAVEIAFTEDENVENIDKEVKTRAIDGNNAEQSSDGKFKVYVGTIDGVRREIFNEVDGGDNFVSPDQTAPQVGDQFGAYDDNLIIATENEKNLFVPKPYRPGGNKKETKKPTTTTQRPTTTQPPTTIRTIPPVFATQPRQPQPPVTAAPFRPSFPVNPPRVFATNPPVTNPPFTRQQFTNPPITQAPFTRAPFSQPPFRQPNPPFQPQQFTRQPPFQPNTQQQQFRTQRPFQPQTFQQPETRTRRPPTQPPVFRPPVTSAPQLPFANTQNLRSGVCHASIFYISTPITGPTRLSFTHFAIAVTVDQCARTCHEFNCAIAHYNPGNGHCEFNPSTAFAIRNGQCPAWPSLHYRNNVVASEPVRIFCATCQRPRRRPNRQRNGFNRNFRHRDSQRGGRGIFGGSRTARRPFSEHPVIHGVLVKQPKSVALGTSQLSFLDTVKPAAHGVAQVEIPVNVSPVEFEESDFGSHESFRKSAKSRAEGLTTNQNQLRGSGEQLSLLKELETLQSS